MNESTFLPMPAHLYTPYDIGTQEFKPFSTIDELVVQMPTNEKLLARSHDDDQRNQHERQRMRWLNQYLKTMFEPKAELGNRIFSVPLSGDPNILCITSKTSSRNERHWCGIYSLNDKKTFHADSISYATFMEEQRGYKTNISDMSNRSVTIMNNTLFLLDKMKVTQRDKVVNLDPFNLKDKNLPCVYGDLTL